MHELTFVVPIVASLIIYWARIAELKKRRDVVHGEVRESLTLRLFVAVGSLMLLGSIAEYLWARPPFDVPLFAAGLLVAVASFVLRRRAIRELGKMWSL